MTAYATRRDVYRYGLPRGSLGSSARELASVTASTNLLELDDHGFENDEPVAVRAAEGGTLAGGLVADTTYYVIRVSDSTFKLAATPSGSAINITSDGVDMVVIAESPIDDILEAVSELADGYMPHLVPLTAPYPKTVVMTVATIAGRRWQNLSGTISDAVIALEEQAWKQLERWAKGVPVRAANVTASSNLAVTASLASTTDRRGWGSGTLP